MKYTRFNSQSILREGGKRSLTCGVRRAPSRSLVYAKANPSAALRPFAEQAQTHSQPRMWEWPLSNFCISRRLFLTYCGLGCY